MNLVSRFVVYLCFCKQKHQDAFLACGMSSPFAKGLLVGLLFILPFLSNAQVFKDNFGTAAISTHPYNSSPVIINSLLSSPVWTNSQSSWSWDVGSGGGSDKAIRVLNTPSGTTLTLSIQVASGYRLSISNFSMWVKSATGGANLWTMSVNGTEIGSGDPDRGNPGSNTGTRTVTNANGLIGTVLVTIQLEGGGNAKPFLVDDFTLNGTIDCIPNPSIDIVSSPTPVSICSGNSVTFTATATDAGTSPAYQWRVNGANVSGATNSTFPTTALNNGDIITCEVTRSGACPASAISNEITAAVNPAVVPTATIFVGSTTVCSGTGVTYTASITNGGLSPTYQWKVNGVNVGNGVSYTHVPTNGNVIALQLVSNAVCATPTTVNAPTVTMTVNSTLPVSASVVASATNICEGTSVTFSATPTNGGTTPSYQWLVNGVNAGTNSATFSSTTLVNGEKVKVVLNSSEGCTSGDPATSNEITMAVSPLKPVSVSIAADKTTICATESVNFSIATISNQGTAPVYQWQKSTDGGASWTNVGASSTLTAASITNGNQFRLVLTSNEPCATTNPATSNVISITISPNASLSLSSAPATTNQTVCQSSAINNITYAIGGSATGASVSWLPSTPSGLSGNYSSGVFTISGTPTTSGTFNYTVTTTGGCTNATATGTIVVRQLPSASISIGGSASATICAGSSVNVTFSSLPSLLNSVVTYKVNGGADQTINLTGGTATLGSGALSANTVYSLVGVAYSDVPGCAQFIGGSATVNVTTPVTPSVVISTSSTEICSGSSLIFTAATTNGGAAPTYQWQLSTNGGSTWTNVGTNSPTYNYSGTANYQVRVVLTSNAACATPTTATSNTVIVNVYNSISSITPSVILPWTTSLCPSTTTTYSVSPIAGATTYEWVVQSPLTIISGQGTSSITVGASASGTNKSISVTAWNPCGYSKTYTTPKARVVNIATFSGATLGPDVTICSGTPIYLVAELLGNANDGTWSSPNGTFGISSDSSSGPKDFKTVIFTPSILSGTAVVTFQPNGSTCGSGTPAADILNITIRNPLSGAVSTTTSTICGGSSATLNFLGQPNSTLTYKVGAGANQTINLGASGSATVSTAALSANTTITLVSAAYNTAPTCTSLISGSVSITVNPAASANAIASQTTICAGSTIDLSGSSYSGATSVSWTSIPGSGSFSNSSSTNTTYTPALTSGTVTLTLSTNDPDGAGPCAAATSSVVITINPVAVVNAGVAQTVCQSATPVAVTLSGASVSGGTTNGSWSIVSGGGTMSSTGPTSNPAAITYTPAANYAGSATLLLSSSDPDGAGPCAIVQSTVVFTMNQAATVSANTDQSVCGIGTIALNGTIGGSATSATWTAPSGSIFYPTSPTSLYTPSASVLGSSVTLTLTTNDPDGAGPCLAKSDQMLVTVSRPATVTPAGPNTICQSSSPSAITLSGGAFGGAATQAAWSIVSGGGSLSSTSYTATPWTVAYTPAANYSGVVVLSITTNDPDGSGPCAAISDDRTINIDPAATANAGPSQTICSNASATLNGSVSGTASTGTWTTAGSGTFNNSALANAVYSPSFADVLSGSAMLTYTTDDPTGPCGSASSTVVVSIKKSPTITTQPTNKAVCYTYPTSLSVAASGDNLTYQWYKGVAPSGTPLANGPTVTGATSATLTFTQTAIADEGSYYVVVSGASQCASVTSNTVSIGVDQQIFITQQPLPQTVCNGQSFTLSVVANAGGDPLTYQWYKDNVAIAGETNNSLTISSANHNSDPGNYHVVIDGISGYACNKAFSSIVAVAVTSPVSTPVFVMGATSTVCQNPGTITYSANNNNGVLSYSLSPVVAGTINTTTGAVAYDAAFFGTAIITATSSGCQGPKMATHTVTVTQMPTASISYSGVSGIPPTSIFCVNNATLQTVNRTGTGAFTSGVYSSTPVGLSLNAAGSINPATSTPEKTYIISYTIAAAGGCPAVVATATVRIDTLPKGGTITQFTNQVCASGNAGTLTLSGHVGTILRWESSTNAGTTWTTIANTTTTLSFSGLTATTIYRAVLANGGCGGLTAYSDLAAVSVVSAFTPTVTIDKTELCPYEFANIVASGLPPIDPLPIEEFQTANPQGWEGYDASGNNVDDNTNWNEQGLGTNNRYECGIEFLSQLPPTTSKFMIAKGVTDNADLTTTLYSPFFDLTLVQNANLEFWTAGLFNNGAIGYVEVSIDNMVTWSILKTYTSSIGNPTNGFVKQSLSLLQYLGQTKVRFRFRYKGASCDAWGLDNIGIQNISPPITYLWTPSTYLNTTSGPAVITTPTDPGPYNITYTVTPTVGLCPGNPVSVMVTVKPTLKLTPSVSSQTVCSNGTVPPVTIASNIDNTTYSWTMSTLPNGVTYTGVTSGGPYSIALMNTTQNLDGLTGTFTNTTATQQTVYLVLTATATKICAQAPDTVTLLINPNPVVSLAGSYNCLNNTASITITTTSGVAASGLLQPGNIAFSGTGPTISLTVPISTATTYSISAMTVAGCTVSAGILPSPVTVSTTLPGQAGLWVGTVDNDWFNKCNWANLLVPDNTVDVNIPGTAVRYCEINPNTSPYANTYGNVARSKNILIDNQELRFGPSVAINSLLNVAGNLTIQNSNGYINMLAGGEIELVGNWINNKGTSGFAEGQGTVEEIGIAVQNIITVSSTEAFNNLIINNTSNLNNGVTLLKNATVSGVFTLIDGRVLTTQSTLLTVINNVTTAVVGGATNTYVNGPMARWTAGTGDYNFPVGKPTGPYRVYRPAIVAPASAIATTYNVEYKTVLPVENLGNRFITGILNSEHWEIKRTSGSANAIVKLDYINPNNSNHWTDVGPCFNCNVAIVKAYAAASDYWYFSNFQNSDIGFSSSLPEYRSHADNGLIWSKLISSFSPFTFGYTYNIVLPINLLTFKGRIQQEAAHLEWTLSDNKEHAQTELEHSIDGNNFRKIATIASGANTNYGYVHNGVNHGANYYRLKLKDKKGEFIYSKVMLLHYEKTAITVIKGLKANPVQHIALVSVFSASFQSAKLKIVDLNGRVVYSEKRDLPKGENTMSVPMPNMANGLYHLYIITDDGVQAALKMLKE